MSGSSIRRRRTTIAVVAAAAITLGLAGCGAVQETKEYKALASELADAKAATRKAEGELAAVTAKLTAAEGTIPAREKAVAAKESQLAQREAAVKSLEKDVRKREKAVGIVETEIENNTIPGSGVYKVGSDIKAGTYKTTGGGDCYYAVLNSTDTSDIATNNSTTGTAFVTVRDGQYLELGSDCGEWVLQR